MSDKLTRLDQMINNLTSADRAWFVKFAMYMRIYGWVRDQPAVSNELMAMAQDLRDAEQDELDAAGYFGHSPRTMAQAILRQLPLIDWGTRLKWFFALASVAWLLLLMFAAGRNAVMQLSIFKFFIVIACLGVEEVGVLALFAKVVYTQHPRWLAARFASLMLICGCLAGATLRWGPNWLSMTLTTPWDFVVIGGSLVLIIGGLSGLGVLRLRWLLNPGGLLIILLLGGALFRRYWLNTATSMTQHQAGWLLLIFGGGSLVYIGWQLFSLRRLRRLKHHR